jgi:hypothetical protein
MKQTGDEYPPHNLVENLLAVLTLKQQNNQSNAQWYEKLNTRVDVAESVGYNSATSLVYGITAAKLGAGENTKR